ncbi:MAG: hypothetical protein ACRBBN_09615 [Methyloligellaceae bacterium]
MKLLKNLALVLFAGLTLTLYTGFSTSAEAGYKSKSKQKYTAHQVAKRLKARGFYKIRITDARAPYYDFDACYKGKQYELTIDYKGNVKDKDLEGRCGKKLSKLEKLKAKIAARRHARAAKRAHLKHKIKAKRKQRAKARAERKAARMARKDTGK